MRGGDLGGAAPLDGPGDEDFGVFLAEQLAQLAHVAGENGALLRGERLLRDRRGAVLLVEGIGLAQGFALALRARAHHAELERLHEPAARVGMAHQLRPFAPRGEEHLLQDIQQRVLALRQETTAESEQQVDMLVIELVKPLSLVHGRASFPQCCPYYRACRPGRKEKPCFLIHL